MRLVLIILIFCLSACSNFHVSKDYITGGNFKNGISIDKIKVDSLNEDNFPEIYTEDTSIRLFSIDFQNSRIIYFKKKNNNYYWMFLKPISFEKYDKLPLSFIEGNWYHIWGLEKNGDNEYEMFIYVKKNGNFQVYHKHTPGPF